MHRSLLLLAGILLISTRPGMAQEDVPVSNIQAFQLLAERIGDSLNAQIPDRDSLRVLLSVKPESTAWLVQGGISRALQKRGHIVVVATPAEYQAELGIMEMHVAYGNAHTTGLFSGKVADREVLLIVSARLVDQRSGVVTVNKEFQANVRDTVYVSEIPTLEDANVPVTQGALSGEGFFSSLVEPLIMLGAVAVAVYLLFTVRS